MAMLKPSNAVLATNFEELYHLLREVDEGFFFWLDDPDNTSLIGENLRQFLFPDGEDSTYGLDMLLIYKYGTLKPSRNFSRFFKYDENCNLTFNNQGTLSDLINDLRNEIYRVIVQQNINEWKRLYDTLFAEYSPIENYNMTEDENVGSKINVKSSQDISTYGFDSSDPVPTGEAGADVTTEGKFNDNHRQLKRHGNIGVTTNQAMAEQEIALRRNKLLDIIISDVIGFLTRPQF